MKLQTNAELLAELETTRAALNLSRERAEDAEADLERETDRANAAELELASIRAKEDADLAGMDAWMDEEGARRESAKNEPTPRTESPEVEIAARRLIKEYGWPAAVVGAARAAGSEFPF